jgi:hypothetical protein
VENLYVMAHVPRADLISTLAAGADAGKEKAFHEVDRPFPLERIVLEAPGQVLIDVPARYLQHFGKRQDGVQRYAGTSLQDNALYVYLAKKVHSPLPRRTTPIRTAPLPNGLHGCVCMWQGRRSPNFHIQRICLTDMKEGRSTEKQQMVQNPPSNLAHFGPPARSICLRGVLKSCLGVSDYRRFHFCWLLRSKPSRSTDIPPPTAQLAATPGAAAGRVP